MGEGAATDPTNTRLYRALDVAAKFLLLNLAWLLACVPLLTVYSATAAMFGVVREWVQGRDPPVVRAFLGLFKQTFRQSLWVGLLWTSAGVVLAANFALIGQMSSLLWFPLFVVTVFAGVLYAGASVYLFPVMVNYETTWVNVIRNALLMAVTHLPVTVACLLVVGAMLALTLSVAISVLFTGSVTAYVVYRLYEAAFRKTAKLKRVAQRNALEERD